MLIIGCDFHAGFQQVAIFDNRTGEVQEKAVAAPRGGGEHRSLAGQSVRVGMEARALSVVRAVAGGAGLSSCGSAMRRGCGLQWCINRKTDRRDADHLLQLLIQDRFHGSGCRAWKCDVRQLLVHRHKPCRHSTRKLSTSDGTEPGRAEKYKLWTKAGRRSWSSCLCCRTQPNGDSCCCGRWTRWKRRSANWTEGGGKRGSGGGGAVDDASGVGQ